MPIVHVRSLPIAPDVARALVDALPAALSQDSGVDATRVWATWAPIDALSVGGRPPAGGGIAFVDVRLRPRDPETTGRLLQAAAHCVADILGLPRTEVWAHAIEVEDGWLYAGDGLR
jgi:phenylpyruvate tautomerase PptA (4-oxalocrotonate tautomerase family)